MAMASAGRDPSSRMSEEDYKLMCEVAVKYFKEHKVEISDAIKKPYPFLETLRDREFITNEKYDEFQRSCKNLSTVPKVVYAVLNKMEETRHLPLLEMLFSKVIMKNYPELKGICEDFRDVILKKIGHKARAGDGSAENRNTPLIIEQGTGKNPCLFLSWLFSDQDTVTSSEDSVEHKNKGKPPKASTSAPKRKAESTKLKKSSTAGNKPCKRVKTTEASSGVSAVETRPEAGGSAVTSGAAQEGVKDLGNQSALQNPKKKSTKEPPGGSVNFRAEILPVKCGAMTGLLIKRKLEQGAARKCIRTEDGNWFTPREFEFRGGYQGSSWKINLTCGGKTLKELIKLGDIPEPPITREGRTEEENSDKCKICRDGGRLFCCENCQSFFHGDCHLPPVDKKRNGWNCTFCTTESFFQSQQHCTESEVLVKQMETWTKLKCEFLLLNVYHHLESNIFPNIPRGNYVTKATQYLGKLRKLDTIKKNLIKENYSKVKDFKEAMDKFFEDPRRDKLHLNQEEFMKNFKKVFAIQEMK